MKTKYAIKAHRTHEVIVQNIKDPDFIFFSYNKEEPLRLPKNKAFFIGDDKDTFYYNTLDRDGNPVACMGFEDSMMGMTAVLIDSVAADKRKDFSTVR